MTFDQLQLLIASANESTAEPAVFWSWTGVVAICAVLIAASSAADWLLYKKQKFLILQKLNRTQEKLERLPVRDWQVAVARTGVRFWDALGGVVPTMGRWLGTTLNCIRGTGDWSFWVLMCCLAAVFAISIVGARPLLSQISHWSGDLLISCVIAIVGGTLVAGVEYVNPSRNALFAWLAVALTEFFPALAFSFTFTLLAAVLGTSLHDCTFETAWFECNTVLSNATPHIRGLAWTNFVFDFVTILLSYRILNYVVKSRKNIVPLAVLDIGLSAILTVLLHTVLLWTAPEESLDLSDAVTIAWDWFFQVVTFGAPSTHPNWPLTPILFTTFIPVALYMSAFLFLGIIVKPFARASAYICGLLWEKEQTPFRVFAVTLSGMVAFAKALSEWKWLVD